MRVLGGQRARRRCCAPAMCPCCCHSRARAQSAIAPPKQRRAIARRLQTPRSNLTARVTRATTRSESAAAGSSTHRASPHPCFAGSAHAPPHGSVAPQRAPCAPAAVCRSRAAAQHGPPAAPALWAGQPREFAAKHLAECGRAAARRRAAQVRAAGCGEPVRSRMRVCVCGSGAQRPLVPAASNPPSSLARSRIPPARSKGAAFVVSEASRSIQDLQKGIEAQANTINQGARGGVRHMTRGLKVYYAQRRPVRCAWP